MNKMTLWKDEHNKIYFFALFSSIFLSLWISYHSLINPDGICYLLSAELVGTTPLKDIIHFCPQAQWPFYTTLIYALGKLTHLSYFASAHILNALFSVMTVLSFILIVKEMGGTPRVLWLAALVILFYHQFNILRISIIRDHGFWAFYLCSLFFMVRCLAKPAPSAAFAWAISMFIASLFRVEGIIFLILMPFLSWLNFRESIQQRAVSFFMLNLPLIFVICLLGVVQLFYPQQIGLGRINEIINQIENGFALLTSQYYASKTALIQHVLVPESIPDAGVLVILMLAGWYIYNVVLTLSWIYTLLIAYAWKSRAATLPRTASLVIWGYFIVNLLITFIFLAERLFISKRYLVALTLILLLWIPFALEDLLQKWKSWQHRILLLLCIIIIFSSAASSVIHFGPSKVYIRSAGNWIAGHVPKEAKLYVNDFQLMYYTQHFGMDIFKIYNSWSSVNNVIHQGWKNYDYLAIRLNHGSQGEITKVLQEIKPLKPVQVFHNTRGDSIIIYRIS